MELKELFGSSMRQCRRARRLTQAQLAETTELSLEMIGRLERGLTAPSFETIAAIAAALKVGPAVLFGAEATEIEWKRREVLQRINKLLADTSEPELQRAERVLNALLSR